MAESSKQAEMVAQEAARGITDPKVQDAMAEVDRRRFVPARHRAAAFEERPLPIGAGQTISQPWIVAAMTQALKLTGRERVLEVGTGSGYQAAILRQIVPRVVSVERIAALAEQAWERLDQLGIDSVEIHVGDGSLGWEPDAPYDAIVVTAAGPDVPAALIDQLAPGGRLVMPTGSLQAQHLRRITLDRRGRVVEEDLGAVMFVPLIGEEGWPSDGGYSQER